MWPVLIKCVKDCICDTFAYNMVLAHGILLYNDYNLYNI